MPDYLPGAVDVGFQVGDTPIYTFGSERVFQLASDPDGNNEIVSAFAAADVQLITTPKESMANLDTGSGKYTSVPDLLAALHDLTYLTATPIIDDTSFGPFTARRFDYTVDALSSDYKACPGRPCAATMFADRSTLAMLADETGHFVEIDAGGNEILLHVPNQPAFAGVVSSLHVTVHPSPAAANDATIYVSGRLDAGSYYVRPPQPAAMGWCSRPTPQSPGGLGTSTWGRDRLPTIGAF